MADDRAMGLRVVLTGLAADGDLDEMATRLKPYYSEPELLAQLAIDLAAQVARMTRVGLRA